MSAPPRQRRAEPPDAPVQAPLHAPVTAPLYARLLLMFSVALLCAVGALYFLADGVGTPAGSAHLTRADWQAVASRGYSAPPATLDAGALPPVWQPVTLPLALPISLLRQADSRDTAQRSTTTWLRLSTRGLPAGHGALALYGIRVKTDGTVAVYADGRLVHRAQQQGPLWNSTRTPLWVVLDKDAGAPAQVHEIVLRLEHSAHSQVALSSLWLGPVESLRARHHMRQWLQQELPAMLSAAFLAVGIFALFIWLQRRHEIGYLLFFNLSVASFLRGLHFYIGLPIVNDWFAWLTVNSLFWLVAAVHFFLCLLHGRPLTWLTRGLLGTTALIALLTLPGLALLPNTPQVTPLLYLMAALMGGTACLVGGISAWRRSSEGRLIAVGVGACTLLGLSDWLLQNNLLSPEGWYLGAYANAVCFIAFGTLMYRRYLNALHEVEQANANLAQRLQQRETELEHSHARLREVELQQTLSGERQRLMQDMHDGLGSSLISAIRSVERGGMSDKRISQVLKDCLDDLKLTIDSMEPVEADLLLLLATLRFRLGPRLEDSGIKLLWEVRELPALAWLAPSSGLHILRIIQESIANILRHTGATEIRVGTALAAGGVQVTIADNGAGFDVARALAGAGTGTAAGAGRGLQNQQRRAQAVGGAVSWQSDPAGTRFTLWLPREAAAGSGG